MGQVREILAGYHPCAGAMQIFSESLQFKHNVSKEDPGGVRRNTKAPKMRMLARRGKRRMGAVETDGVRGAHALYVAKGG